MFSIYVIYLYLQPRWSDLDVNQHVNNVKYIGWILEVINLLFLNCYLICP